MLSISHLIIMSSQYLFYTTHCALTVSPVSTMSHPHQASEDNIFSAPGTEILYDQSGDNVESGGEFSSYQHLQKGDSRILLVPQPSLTDPNDPLRWSTTKKWATFVNSLAYAFLGAVTGPIMAACECLQS